MVGLRRTEDVLDIWKSEFRHVYEHVGDGCLVVTMHPQSTGRGHRIGLLRGFLEFVLGHAGASCVRVDEIADDFRNAGPPG